MGAIDIVCNLFTPREVSEGRTGVDQDFLEKIRFPDELRKGVTIEDYLRKMDAAGVERSLLIAVRAGDLRMKGSFEIPYEYVHEICRRYPDRFSGLAGVDPYRGRGSPGQAPDQPGESLGIVAAIDPHAVAAGQIDLDRAARALGIARRGSIFSNGVLDDLDGKKEGTLCRGGVRVRRKPRVTQPFEDEVGVQRMAPSHLRHGNTRHRRLKTDRPLLLYGPEPLGSTRHPKANSVRYPKRTLSDAHWPWQGGVPGRLQTAWA